MATDATTGQVESRMVTPGPRGVDRLLSGEPPTHRTVALRHAAAHGRPGLRGDDPDRPSGLAWLREGDDGNLEAFGAGDPGPILEWLASRADGRPIALLAPTDWESPIRATGDRVESAVIQTRLRPVPMRLPSTKVKVRRLESDDRPAFEAVAPPWAARSWGDFATLIGLGAAIGVTSPCGLLAMAWIYESDRDHDKVGVFTIPHYRRLGLGRAATGALVDHIVRDRRKHPLWVTTPDNPASVSLAESLGFSVPVEETLLRWTPSKA